MNNQLIITRKYLTFNLNRKVISWGSLAEEQIFNMDYIKLGIFEDISNLFKEKNITDKNINKFIETTKQKVKSGIVKHLNEFPIGKINIRINNIYDNNYSYNINKYITDNIISQKINNAVIKINKELNHLYNCNIEKNIYEITESIVFDYIPIFVGDSFECFNKGDKIIDIPNKILNIIGFDDLFYSLSLKFIKIFIMKLKELYIKDYCTLKPKDLSDKYLDFTQNYLKYLSQIVMMENNNEYKLSNKN